MGTRLLALLIVSASLLIACGGRDSAPGISVTVGPTPIPRGDAKGAKDITVNNGLFAIAFAVDTPSPWGVARGGIVDIALVTDGKVGYDIASLADFMPNNWSSWPTTYQRVEIEKETDDEVVIVTERDWGDVALNTRFIIRASNSVVTISTFMTNNGDEDLADLLTGYVVWPDGGYLFGVPGLSGLASSAEDEALANWTAAYNKDWVLGLHAPFAKFVSYNGRDRYLPHTLAVGETKAFDAWLQIETGGDLAPIVVEGARQDRLETGVVSGVVTNRSGGKVKSPAVVAAVDGKPFAFTTGANGAFEFSLPAGKYELYATAAGHSASRAVPVAVNAGVSTSVELAPIDGPGTLTVSVTAADSTAPLDARISIKTGQKALIEYFGRNTFFTELDPAGQATMQMAPGNYELEISAGGGFSSELQSREVTIEPDKAATLAVEIPVAARPQEFNWYSADLHHHSDVLDGFTDPESVMRSELASGIDVTFLSDHDSMINNAELRRLSAQRGMDFISSAEISPSWAHFNAYPVDESKSIDIDVGASPVQEVFAEARRLGAEVIAANHPYGDYGYFRSLDLNEVPGGYDDGFDAIEITAGDNSQTLARAWQLWNDGKRAYLVGGSDVHDVWNEVSGASRTYAYIEGAPDADSFIAAVKAGNAYASQGPLVYPAIMFGSDIESMAGDDITIAFAAMSVAGLQSVALIEQGQVAETLELSGDKSLMQLWFVVNPEQSTWYSLLVEDSAGKLAYTNPIWVTVP